jgi:hypothetical protein
MNTFTRLALITLLALAAAACTPKVGIATSSGSPAQGGKPVMVIPSESVPGTPGDRIELAAWGFTEPGATRVWFGRAEATGVTVVDGWRVQVDVPAGAGKVDVCIENGAGAWVLLEAFQYAEGTGVEHCWPSSDVIAKVETAKKRIAAVQTAKKTRLASISRSRTEHSSRRSGRVRAPSGDDAAELFFVWSSE